MNARLRLVVFAAAPLSFAALSASPAMADVPGFGLLNPSMWQVNYDDTGTPVALIEPGTIEVTGASRQTRSIFFRIPQGVERFSVSWTYEGRYISACCSVAGFSLVIQNDPRGDEAIGGTCGYTGIRTSVAAVFDAIDSRFGYWKDGASGSFVGMNGVDLISRNPIEFTVEYDGNLLTVEAIDTVTGDQFNRIVLAGDITDDVGGEAALIGIGADTSVMNLVQTFSNFSYTVIAPCPADLDFDGELTLFDFLAFQNLFDLADPRADFDGDGELTIFDFLAFQNAFDAGCP